jgi:3-dehydro-L-gulonate-6-phosphate decarboxylase
MSSIPMLQLALDYISLPTALSMAMKVAPEVDILEVGTPLCKAAGMEAVRVMHEVYPDKLILADLKTPDVGGLEAQMAFDAGADMMTVIGGAPLITVKQAQEAADKNGKQMLVDVTGVKDILAAGREWRTIGVKGVVYHRGWDEGVGERKWGESDREIIRALIQMGFRVSIAGGITLELLPFFKDLAVSIVNIGREIRETPDPTASARRVKLLIQQLWGGGSPVTLARTAGPPMGADLLAKAIRWGVSEMGLLLTVDGRDCPGCDSPGRFCLGTRTTIQCPQGLRADDVVQRLSQIIHSSGAFGRLADDTVYLDPAELADLSRSRVIDLLNATGNSFRQLGCLVDVEAGIKAANLALGIS